MQDSCMRLGLDLISQRCSSTTFVPYLQMDLVVLKPVPQVTMAYVIFGVILVEESVFFFYFTKNSDFFSS